MTDKEEGEDTVPRGHEWEVVSLTASAYAASPSPQAGELKNDHVVDDVGETSRAMVMATHFMIPPSEQEDLQLEPECDTDIKNEVCEDKPVVPKLDVKKGELDMRVEGDWDIKGLTATDEFHGMQFFDETGNTIEIQDTKFEEGTTLEVLNCLDVEQSAIKLDSFCCETTISEPMAYVPDLMASLSDTHESLKPSKDDKHDGYDPPSEAWWRRRVAYLYANAKRVNSRWSIVIAAAVLGLVIIGHRWQKERCQVLQLKWHCSVGDAEKMSLFSRLKDTVVGGQGRSSIGTNVS